MNNFCAFILTHGRPNNVITYNTLLKAGYTGKIYIVIDNEDKEADNYYKIYGDKVIMFDKKEVAKTFDEADNFNDRRAIVYARNACFNIAKKLNIEYFIQLDDDYGSFHYRLYETNKSKPKLIKNLDRVFTIMLDYYKNITASSIAMAQGGDFIGGAKSGNAKNKALKRKCMNSFICSTNRKFTFLGRINEDVNTYTSEASKGLLLLTIPIVSLEQKTTQSNTGGMTDIYLDVGTYIKSFYSVIFSPSCVKIALMGDKNKRLHHQVSWNNAVPVILQENVKK